jgi:hypothetical protein
MENEEIQNVLVEKNVEEDGQDNEEQEFFEIKKEENKEGDENDDMKEEEANVPVLVQKVEEQNVEKEEEEEEEGELDLNEKNENKEIVLNEEENNEDENGETKIEKIEVSDNKENVDEENEGENKIVENEETVEKKDTEKEKEEEEEEIEVEEEKEEEEKEEKDENIELAIKTNNEDDENENNNEEPQEIEKKLIEEKECNDIINKLNLGNSQVVILYSKDKDDYNIIFKQKSSSEKLILHWGIYNNCPITEWHHPNKENYPLKTKEFDSFALQTEFIDEGEESKIEFKLPKKDAQGMGISFVFYDPINNIWYNNDNKDYQVEYF